jgi:transposase
MFTLTPGNIHDSTAFDVLLMTFLVYVGSMQWRRRLKWIICDKGYDCQRIVDLCIENNLTPVIPKRKKPNGEERENPNFDKEKYKERNLIERCIGWLKENRRIATRYEKLALTYKAMIQLGAIRRFLRAV